MNDVYRRTARSVLFAGAAQFVLAMFVAEALYPGYSVSGNYISDLGVGRTAALFNTSVFLLGAALLLGAYLIFYAFRKATVVVLLTLTGLGAMGVGIFPETAGYVHTAVSFIAFFFGTLGALSIVFSHALVRPPLNYFGAAAGAISFAALVLFGSGQYLGLGPGGMERMVAYPLLLWAIAFGGHLMGYSGKPSVTAEGRGEKTAGLSHRDATSPGSS